MISFNLFLRIKIFVVHVGPVCSVVYVYSCYSFHIFINKTVFRNLNDIYISYKRKSKSYFYFIHISKKKIHRYLLGQNESLKKKFRYDLGLSLFAQNLQRANGLWLFRSAVASSNFPEECASG